MEAVLTMPIERSGKYVFELDDTLFEVSPEHGGRITRFELDGVNVLSGPEQNRDNWGSTFWPSPQAAWGWPPTPALDKEPYTAKVEGSTLVLQSAVATIESGGAAKRLRVAKRFRASLERRAIVIDYTLSNEGERAERWAPWEISRVHPRGLTFFPSGPGGLRMNHLDTSEVDGIRWYQHDPSFVPSDDLGKKLCADGAEGWIAHAGSGLLFLKTFDDVPAADQAPEPEGEIEIYGARNYVEVEQQGRYTELAPGASLSWTVRWLLRSIPSHVDVGIGSAPLVALARSLAAD